MDFFRKGKEFLKMIEQFIFEDGKFTKKRKVGHTECKRIKVKHSFSEEYKTQSQAKNDDSKGNDEFEGENNVNKVISCSIPSQDTLPMNRKVEMLFPTFIAYKEFIKNEHEKIFPPPSECFLKSSGIYGQNKVKFEKTIDYLCECVFLRDPSEDIRFVDQELRRQAVRKYEELKTDHDIKKNKEANDGSGNSKNDEKETLKNILILISEKHQQLRWEYLENNYHIHLDRRYLSDSDFNGNCKECIESKLFRIIRTEFEGRIKRCLEKLAMVVRNLDILENNRGETTDILGNKDKYNDAPDVVRKYKMNIRLYTYQEIKHVYDDYVNIGEKENYNHVGMYISSDNSNSASYNNNLASDDDTNYDTEGNYHLNQDGYSMNNNFCQDEDDEYLYLKEETRTKRNEKNTTADDILNDCKGTIKDIYDILNEFVGYSGICNYSLKEYRDVIERAILNYGKNLVKNPLLTGLKFERLFNENLKKYNNEGEFSNHKQFDNNKKDNDDNICNNNDNLNFNDNK